MRDIAKIDPKSTKIKDPAVSLTKAIAMILIINSHSDILFPPQISFLASGGALGNELFFLMGGYLYSRKGNFFFECKRRFIRLYVPTYIMTLALFLVGYIHLSDFADPVEIFHLLLWPSQFWFVSAIFVYSLIMYFFSRTKVFRNSKIFMIYSVIWWAFIVFLYFISVPDKTIWIVEDQKIFGTTVYFKCFYSFYVYTLGYYLKLHKDKWQKYDSKKCLFSFIFFFLAFYGFKLMLSRSAALMQYQIISQPITVLCVTSLFLYLENSTLISKMMRNNRVRNVCILLGDITLEAFLVQFQIISRIAETGLIFPANYIISLILIIGASYCFSLLNKSITKRLLS